MFSAQIEILRGKNPANPLCSYIGEALAIEGFTHRWVDAPTGRDALLILPHLLESEEQSEMIRTHVRDGGSVIALRPSLLLADVFGLAVHGGQRWAGYTRHPDGEMMQIHGGSDLYRLAGGEEIAPLLEGFDGDLAGRRPAGPAHPAVARVEGGGGRRVCFAYDLARCLVLLQQGRPDQASDGAFANADGDWKFSQNDMFTGHLDPRLKNTPQADLHRDLLVRMIGWTTEKTKAVPRVWRFPNLEETGAMIDGDGDNATKEIFDLAFSTCEEFGIPYSTYLMEEQFDALTPSDAKALRARGHTVGLHPWLGPYPTLEEFETYLKKAFGNFRDLYGYIPSASRNHCIIWTGWVDLPRVESEIGVRMDLNGYSGRHFQSGVQSGTLLPVKFMDARGRLIDIYSQFTFITDDGWVEDKHHLPALTEPQRIEETHRWVDRCFQYQGMFHPTFHPLRMKSFGEPTLPWFRETLGHLQSRKVRGWSADAWTSFNDARRGVSVESNGSVWQIKAERALQGLSIVLPERVGTKFLLDGKPLEGRSFKTAGRAHVGVVLDVAGNQVRELKIRL